MNLWYRLWILLHLIGITTSCNRQHSSDTTMHYSEAMLQTFAKISDQQQSRDTGFFLIDSLYKTFPYISAADRFRYYDFKRNLYEVIRYGNRSYDTAIAYTDSSIAVIEGNKLEKEMSKDYLRAFTTRGDYYIRIQRYNYAIRDITRSKQLNQEAGDSCLEAENTKTLSAIAINQANFPLAVTLLKEAIVLAGGCKIDKDQFIRMQRYLDDLGFIYSASKKYDSSVIYHLAAAKYIEENKQLMGQDTLFVFSALENIYGNLGLIYFKKNNYADAETYIRKAMMLSKGSGLAKLQYLLGSVFFKSGRIKEAEAMAEKSAAEINNFEVVFRSDLLELKSGIAKSKKQYKEALEYQESFRLARDTVFRGRIELLKKNPFVEYEQLDKKYEVELLKKDNRIQQNKTNAAIVIGSLLTLLAIISLYLIWRLRTVMKKRSLVYKQLVASEKELKETMLQKEIAERRLRENELFALEMQLQMEFNESIIQQRQQISDDMHDELSSSLAALKYYVEDVKNKSVGTTVEKSLSDITEEVNAVYKNARSYMHSLKTNNWETQFSLIGFLSEIQQKFANKGLMIVKLELEEEKIKSLLSNQQHDQLYHIVKEAISNVIKHAGATELVIEVGFNAGNCICTISDNGAGFNKEQVQYGIGIESIQKRAKELGGGMAIQSSNNGTIIIIDFPLQ